MFIPRQGFIIFPSPEENLILSIPHETIAEEQVLKTNFFDCSVFRLGASDANDSSPYQRFIFPDLPPSQHYVDLVIKGLPRPVFEELSISTEEFLVLLP